MRILEVCLKLLRNRDFLPRNIPYGRIPRGGPGPAFPYIESGPGFYQAVCPQCKKVTTIRTCQSCRQLMCEECLMEHEGECLKTKK